MKSYLDALCRLDNKCPVGDTSTVEQALLEIRNRTFQGEIVCLDDHFFIHCTFRNCELRYDGGPVMLQETSFEGCCWCFGGAAQRVIKLLELFGMRGPRESQVQAPEHRLAC